MYKLLCLFALVAVAVAAPAPEAAPEPAPEPGLLAPGLAPALAYNPGYVHVPSIYPAYPPVAYNGAISYSSYPYGRYIYEPRYA